ncbi:gustatory receptor for sugar taste 64f-like [Tribolium madens]|uniref:gustatory receptor for sugar taste 64f-like n=1 Tax=Tribolium madens TaxID=41895 RepID=UPI001CF7474B|nr:gustatory receptor for sugar taste 64f-like [Tribolium madens]
MKVFSNNNTQNDLFHHRIKWIVLLGQTFGLLPVNGVTSEKFDLTFSWYSTKVFYSNIIIFGSILSTTTTFYRIIHSGYNLTTFGSFIFNANAAIEGIIFFNLAKSWPELIRKWSRVETSLANWKNNKSLKRKFYLVISTIMSAAAVEHILSIVNNWSQIPSDVEDKYSTYFIKSYPHLFNFFEFSIPLAIFAVVMNLCNVFVWNFLDGFLIIISIALSEKFRQVTAGVIVAHNEKIHFKHHWIKLREDYNQISVLCKTVNNKISTLIIVSFGTNMFFIVSQLYWSLSLVKTTPVESIYFSFSFGLLVLRTIAVTLFASNINDESKKSMNYLLSLSSDIYNTDIERFAFQIHSQPVALTGNDFFTITRGLLFSMAGSIVTYELFLIQSNEVLTF